MQRHSSASRVPARDTSPWFEMHAERLFAPGARVLDLACGAGRHAVRAAQLGATVVAIDWSEERLALARERARLANVTVEWRRENLERIGIPDSAFEVVMAFNYLDRRRFPDFVRAVSPGGFLLYETFHVGQVELGWGPTSPEHLLEPLELLDLAEPLVVEFSREVLETIDTRSAALASVLARRPVE